jgi:hypothetical protein
VRNTLRVWIFLLGMSSALCATPLCSNTTLNVYIALGTGGCQIGNTIFSNFSYTDSLLSLSDTVDQSVPSSDVDVTIGGTAIAPTLLFTTTNLQWQALDGFQTLVDIGYTVTAPAATPIESSSSGVTGTVQANGGFSSDVNAQLNYSFDSTILSPNPVLVPSVCGSSATTCTNTVSSVITLGNVLEVTVGDIITLDSGGSGNSSPNVATLTQVQQTFSEVPEPSTLLVVGLGLLGCGWLVVRRRHTERPD